MDSRSSGPTSAGVTTGWTYVALARHARMPSWRARVQAARAHHLPVPPPGARVSPASARFRAINSADRRRPARLAPTPARCGPSPTRCSRAAGRHAQPLACERLVGQPPDVRNRRTTDVRAIGALACARLRQAKRQHGVLRATRRCTSRSGSAEDARDRVSSSLRSASFTSQQRRRVALQLAISRSCEGGSRLPLRREEQGVARNGRYVSLVPSGRVCGDSRDTRPWAEEPA
jgi:hypothetical protein